MGDGLHADQLERGDVGLEGRDAPAEEEEEEEERDRISFDRVPRVAICMQCACMHLYYRVLSAARAKASMARMILRMWQQTKTEQMVTKTTAKFISPWLLEDCTLIRAWRIPLQQHQQHDPG